MVSAWGAKLEPFSLHHKSANGLAGALVTMEVFKRCAQLACMLL